MQICKLTDGQPSDIGPTPESIPGVSNPMLSDMLARGWLLYVPSDTQHIKASHWERQGDACVQVVDATYSQEELAAQAAQAAEDEAARQAAESAAAAAAVAAMQAWEQDLDQYETRQRAIVAVMVEEVNHLRGWIEAFKAAVAEATSLADLKTRTAALAAMPDRTGAQAKAAIAAKVAALQ